MERLTGSVSRDVSTLVISVKSIVQSNDIDESSGSSESDLVGKVPRQIFVLLERGHVLNSSEVLVAVDSGGDGEGLGDTVEGVLEGGLPVLGLLHSLLVGSGELGVVAGGKPTH